MVGESRLGMLWFRPDQQKQYEKELHGSERVLLVMGEQSRLINLSSFVRVSALGFELNWARRSKK